MQAEKIDPDFNNIVNRDLNSHSWHVTVKTFLDLGQITDKSRVLEAGCGWGRILVGLRKFCPEAEITGIDITKDFIDKARSLLEREFGQCDVNVLQGDAMELDVQDESFDAIVTTRVLQYVSDPRKAVRNFHRVLRYGGRAVVCLPNKLNPAVRAKYHTRLYSSGDIEKWFESAGFNVIRKSSINFIPSSIYRFRDSNRVVQAMEDLMQGLPGLRNFGALACVVGEKTR